MDNYSFLGAANTAFFEEIYQQYLKEPDSVESSWRSFFQGYDFANEPTRKMNSKPYYQTHLKKSLRL